MRTVAALLVCASLASPAGERPKVNMAMLVAMQQSLDRRLSGLWPGDPVEVVGVPQSAYISGFGAVFTGHVNLAPTAGISPFHPAITKDEIVRIHQKKVDRLPRLKEAMEDMLLDSAASLDTVPAEEQVAVALTMFYFNGESLAGLPGQIVMRGQRKALLAAKTGHVDRSALAVTIRSEEF